MRLRAALCILCTGLLLIRAEAQHDIVSWIRKCGGVVSTHAMLGPIQLASISPHHSMMGASHGLVQVDLGVGTVNAEGLRGTKAVRDMKKNQIAVHLPMHLAVVLGEPGQASEVSPSAHPACTMF